MVGHQQVVGVEDAFGEVDCFARSGEPCAGVGLEDGPPEAAGWVPCFDEAEACLLDGDSGFTGGAPLETTYRCAPMEGGCTADVTCGGDAGNTLVLACEDGRALGVDCSAVWFESELEADFDWNSTCDPDAARCASGRNGRCGGSVFVCENEEGDRCEQYSGGLGFCERRPTGGGVYDPFTFVCEEEHVSSTALQACAADGSCGVGAVCVDTGEGFQVCLQVCNAECTSFCGPEGFCTPLATGPEEWLVSNEGLVLGGCIPVGSPDSALQAFDVCSTADPCSTGHLCSERTGADGYCRPVCYEDDVCPTELGHRVQCRSEDEFGMSTSCAIDCNSDGDCPRGLTCRSGACVAAGGGRCTEPDCPGVPEPDALATVTTVPQAPPALRGGALSPGTYRLDEVVFHPQGAIASTVVVEFQSQSSGGAAVFDPGVWHMRTSLDLMMVITVPAAGLTIREPVFMEPVGGGCYAVTGAVFDTDATACEPRQDEWIPVPASFPYEANDGGIRLLLAIPRDVMIDVLDEQAIPGLPAPSLILGDLPVVLGFVPVR